MQGDEYVRWVGVKVNDPYLATYGMDEADDIDWSKVGTKKAGPEDDRHGRTTGCARGR